ncbi:SpaA isopeptide-forming pilin-related protein, partial [Vagococcus fessus]
MPAQPTNTVDVTDHLGLSVNFKELDGVTIKGGDTLSLTLPSVISDEGMAKLTAMENNLPVKDENGLVIGHINASDTSIVLTFNDNVNDLKDIRGSFKLKLSAVNTMGEMTESNATQVTGDLGTELPAKTITITRPESGEGTDVFYYKTGTADMDHHKPTWYLVVNPNKEAYKKSIKITDTVGEGHSLIPDSFEITANGADNSYNHYTASELEANGIGKVTVNGNSFEVVINDPYIDNTGINVTYKTYVAKSEPKNLSNESTAYFESDGKIEGSGPDGEVSNMQLDNLVGEAEGEGVKDYIIELLKVSSEDETKVLPGAMFTIYDSDNNLVDTVVTDEFGKTTTPRLPEGIYTIIERKAPDGYVLDETPHKLYVFENEDGSHLTSLTIPNDPEPERVPEGRLVVTKVDNKDKSLFLPGAVFNILNEQNVVIKEGLKTDGKGQFEVDSLPLGKYKLEEIEAPTGYEKSTETFEFEIKEDQETENTTHVMVENKKIIGGLLVTKVDEDDPSKVLEGAVFQLKGTDNDVNLNDLTTDKDGKLKVNELPMGNYELIETAAPKGYELLKSPEVFEIKESDVAGNIIELVVKNKATEIPKPLGQLVITKVDKEDTSKVLAGAEFKLLTVEGEPVKDKLVSDENGKIEVNELELGDYQLIEVKAPKGYDVLTEPISFTVKANEENGNTVNVSVENSKTDEPTEPTDPTEP